MRGGGTVCFDNKNVVRAYQSIVAKTRECLRVDLGNEDVYMIRHPSTFQTCK